MSIQRLEQHFGLRLFSRTTRSLTLTPEGRDLLERTQRLLREAEGIEQGVAAARAEPAGTLKVTAPLPVGVNILAPALPAFRRQHPKVTVDVRLSDRYVDLIEEGVDVAIRVGDPGDTRMIGRRLDRIGFARSRRRNICVSGACRGIRTISCNTIA
jgi:DNA-binding transcriptional LysR family regulator